jgi:hypothetical protein
MSTMNIIFSLDPTALPQNAGGGANGSFEKPWPLSHGFISMRYGYEDGQMHGPVSSDTVISVGAGSRVEFSFVDVQSRPKYTIAPVRLVIASWTPAGSQTQVPSLIDLLNSDDTPVYLPRFEQNHQTYYGYNYVPAGPGTNAWTPDSGQFFANWWPNGANCSRDAAPASPQVRAPYIAMDVADIPGTLVYGVEFKIATNGNDSNSAFWFDPTLQVTR